MHSKPRPKFRETFAGIERFIATSRTARHRAFQFLSVRTLPETKVLIFALDDAFLFGVLSSQIHIIFANAAGGWLGVGNDSTYNHSKCFDCFPFPDPTPEQKQKIRDLGERLDSHHKQAQAHHPDITVTGMYDLLEKLRKGEPFTDKDRKYNDKALVSTLKQIHDALDVAVLEAYGWGDLVPMLGPSPLAPLPKGEGDKKNSSSFVAPADLPSPLGRRAGDEGQTSASDSQPSADLPSPLGRRAGDEGQASAWNNDFSKLAGRWRQISPQYLERIRELRQKQTPAEAFLWELLRSRRFLNAKFRRQHKIGQFIADFYCHDARLVVELDGEVHQTQAMRDHDRNQWMQEQGLTVLRFSNQTVMEDISSVLEEIAEIICPSPLAPLPEGEGDKKNSDNSMVSADLPSPLGRRVGDEGKSLDEIILERLVKLNAERAEEERNGHIRWLRPEYQAPEQTKQTQQTTLEGVTSTAEPIIEPAEQQTWPTQPKEQLAAIRNLLRTQPGTWTVPQIAAQFKGKNTNKKLQAISDNLERLEFFGLVIASDEARSNQTQWHTIEASTIG